MATPDPQKFADDWVRAWIAHDVEAALEHFHDDVVFTSPVTARVLPDTGGVVRGAGQRGADLRRRAGARGPRHLSGVTQYAEIDVLQRTTLFSCETPIWASTGIAGRAFWPKLRHLGPLSTLGSGPHSTLARSANVSMSINFRGSDAVGGQHAREPRIRVVTCSSTATPLYTAPVSSYIKHPGHPARCRQLGTGFPSDDVAGHPGAPAVRVPGLFVQTYWFST